MPLPAESLAALIDQHAVPLRLWAGPRCFDSEDVVQEAFCRLAVCHPPPERPTAWLYQVVRNLASKQRSAHLRRRRRERSVAACEAVRQPPEAAAEEGELLGALENLEQPAREVIVARIWGELTWQEIATLTGCSVATAWRRYRAALEKIRNQIEQPCLNRSR